jgi:hypothetical protein
MDRKEFIEQLKVALRNDKLVTPKHDPNNLGQITYPSYRSVLSYELAMNLEEVITSESNRIQKLGPKTSEARTY